MNKLKSRTLVGWLPEQEGALSIAGRNVSAAPNPDHLAICQSARLAAAGRPEGCDQTDIFSALPVELNVHIEALQANPKSAQILSAVGPLRMVDLRKVCAAQPTVNVEEASARVAHLDAMNTVAIAEVTIPLPKQSMLPVSFDPTKNAWILSSANPNLRVSGNFNGEVQPGMAGIGFAVELSTSYLQVAGVNGRYFLRDGYHRAYGLLAAGINVVPALVHDYATIEDVGMPIGLLSPITYLGNKPPLLTDYLDDTVSVDTTLPVSTKMIVIQALEIASII